MSTEPIRGTQMNIHRVINIMVLLRVGTNFHNLVEELTQISKGSVLLGVVQIGITDGGIFRYTIG